jgi:hypothetical protein
MTNLATVDVSLNRQSSDKNSACGNSSSKKSLKVSKGAVGSEK